LRTQQARILQYSGRVRLNSSTQYVLIVKIYRGINREYLSWHIYSISWLHIVNIYRDIKSWYLSWRCIVVSIVNIYRDIFIQYRGYISWYLSWYQIV